MARRIRNQCAFFPSVTWIPGFPEDSSNACAQAIRLLEETNGARLAALFGPDVLPFTPDWDRILPGQGKGPFLAPRPSTFLCFETVQGKTPTTHVSPASST